MKDKNDIITDIVDLTIDGVIKWKIVYTSSSYDIYSSKYFITDKKYLSMVLGVRKKDRRVNYNNMSLIVSLSTNTSINRIFNLTSNIYPEIINIYSTIE
jgi:hypothetical protein